MDNNLPKHNAIYILKFNVNNEDYYYIGSTTNLH